MFNPRLLILPSLPILPPSVPTSLLPSLPPFLDSFPSKQVLALEPGKQLCFEKTRHLSPSTLQRTRSYFLQNCGMCTWESHKADRRCSKPATTAWCSRCSSCCCPMTCLSTPSPSSSEWLLSSSWCFSCEYGRHAGEPNPVCQL